MDGAVRETFEEIGLKIDKEKLRFIGRHISTKHLIDIYFIKMDVDTDSLVLQEEEVAEVKYVNREDLFNSFTKSDFQDVRYVRIIDTEVNRILNDNDYLSME